MIIGLTPGQFRWYKSPGPGSKVGAKPRGLPRGCSCLELIDALLLELWAEILCFSSCGDSTKQSTVTVSNTRMMFCLTRAFQFDTQMITIKQSTLTLGPKNFFFSGQTGELLPDN